MAEARHDQGNGLHLTHKEAHFAKLILQGCTGVLAYRTAYEVDAATLPKTCAEEASKIRARPNVATMIREGLKQARLQDLDSIGEHIDRTKRAIERTEINGDENVHAKLLDQMGKMHGAFRDTRVLVVENGMSDAELLARLARGSPERLEAAKQLLSVPSEFAESDIIDVTPEPVPAK